MSPIRVGRWQSPLAAALLATMLVMLALDDLPVGVMQDDAMYLVLARALAAGEGFRFTHLVGMPAGVHFPPGYPLLLALIGGIADPMSADIALFKAVNALLMGGCAALMVILLRDRAQLSEPAAVGLALVGAAGIPAFFIATPVMSEPLFLFGLLVLLLAAESSLDASATSARRAIAMGLGAGALTLVRTLALPVVPALAALLWWRGRRQAALLVLGASALLVVPWIVWSGAQAPLWGPWDGKYGRYSDWALDAWRSEGASFIWRSMERTVGETARNFGTMFAPFRHDGGRLLLGRLMLVLLAVGAYSARRRFPVTVLFLVGYGAILLVWPFAPRRFIWAVWPLVLLLLMTSLRALWGEGRTPARRLLASAIVALLMAGHGWYSVRAVRGGFWRDLPTRVIEVSQPAVDWVGTHTMPGTVVATDIELMVGLYADRPTVPLSVVPASEYLRKIQLDTVVTAMRATLLKYEPGVVVLATKPWTTAAERLAAPGGLLRLQDTLPKGGRVYHFVRPPAQ